MSNTDIYPPQNFSTEGPYTVVTSSRTTPTSAWTAPSSSTVMNQQLSGSKARTGLSSSNYQDACDRGALKENAFGYQENVDRLPQGTYAYETKGISGGYFAERYFASGTFPASAVTAPDLLTIPSLRRLNLDNEVKQKVFSKVRDSDVNIAVAWGERAETIHLLSTALSRLGKAYNLAKAGNLVGAAIALTGHKPSHNISNTVAQGWLELQYGWRPLMSDIYGLSTTLQKQMTHREYVVVSSRKKIQEASSRLTVNGNTREYMTADAFYESSVRVKMKSSSMFLKTASEVGLTNPLLVAWELVPFSFVVDWALPIGTFLSQFDSALGWYFEQGSITSFSKYHGTTVREVANVPADYVFFICDIRRDLEQVSVSRTGINTWVEMFSIPYVKNPASIEHALNALALLTNRKR